MNNKLIFLGGTCGSNNWRKDIVIPGLLERGVSPECLFDPVVEHWDEEAQKREDAAKLFADYQLYVIASPDPSAPEVTNVSAYSLVEATMCLYDAAEKTVILVDTTGMAKHTGKAIAKCAADWHKRFPDAPIFADYGSLIEWIAPRLRDDTVEVGSLVKVNVQGYGVKRAEVLSVHLGESGTIYQVGWRNTAWSEGGTAVTRDEILEILPEDE